MLNVQEIHELIKVIDQSSINEFTYETNGTTITIKKAIDVSAIDSLPKQIVSVNEKVETTKDLEPQKTEQTETVSKTKPVKEQLAYDYEIVSPMVGTFYRSANPESEPFVNKGVTVEKNTVVCIVEAMKLFNEIEAEVSGEIIDILVEDGELVEYGQPLFKVKTK